MMSTTVGPIAHPPHPALELLRDLVHERTGLYFDDAKTDVFHGKLSSLIAERAEDSIMDYYYILKDDCAADREWSRVFDALTVQESFFWREMGQIRVLVDVIVPQYFKTHPGEELNIWSAACAGGCEPLTIAIALEEAGWFGREKIHIYASDASPRAIAGARRGLYRENVFRRLPPAVREKYFLRLRSDGAAHGDAVVSQVSSNLHSRVRWQVANLMSERDLALVSRMSPIIFCRNVFIYFSDFAVGKTVRAFAERMPRPGYLFVGMAESMMRNTSGFELREIGDTFVHVRQ
jgi:chemotaxis protein methyltransferase CheR